MAIAVGLTTKLPELLTCVNRDVEFIQLTSRAHIETTTNTVKSGRPAWKQLEGTIAIRPVQSNSRCVLAVIVVVSGCRETKPVDTVLNGSVLFVRQAPGMIMTWFTVDECLPDHSTTIYDRPSGEVELNLISPYSNSWLAQSNPIRLYPTRVECSHVELARGH